MSLEGGVYGYCLLEGRKNGRSSENYELGCKAGNGKPNGNYVLGIRVVNGKSNERQGSDSGAWAFKTHFKWSNFGSRGYWKRMWKLAYR